jgi:hypothetical protein
VPVRRVESSRQAARFAACRYGHRAPSEARHRRARQMSTGQKAALRAPPGAARFAPATPARPDLAWPASGTSHRPSSSWRCFTRKQPTPNENVQRSEPVRRAQRENDADLGECRPGATVLARDSPRYALRAGNGGTVLHIDPTTSLAVAFYWRVRAPDHRPLHAGLVPRLRSAATRLATGGAGSVRRSIR